MIGQNKVMQHHKGSSTWQLNKEYISDTIACICIV